MALQRILEKGTKARTVQGMFFTGHGDADGLHASEDGGGKDILGRALYKAWEIQYRSISLSYKLGLVWSYACDANLGKPSLFSNSLGSEWAPNVNGTLVPLPGGGAIDLNPRLMKP